MKYIAHTLFDIALIGVLAAWLVLGIEGAGNVYTAFVWCITVMCVILILVWSELPKMKQVIRPQWRKRVNAALSIAQVVALFWFGEMLIGSLVLFSGFILSAAEGKAKEARD